MAFFRTPGTERLYSGVTNRTASAFLIRSRKLTQSAGGVASRSWLKNDNPPSVTTSSLSDDGASFVRALASLRENDSLRRLPTMTATLYGDAMKQILWLCAGPADSQQLSTPLERCKCIYL